MTQWYYQLANRVLGPFSLKELQILAAKGKLSPEHHVRRGIHGQWQAAVNVSGLFTAKPVAARPQVPSAPTANDGKPSSGTERVILGTAIGAGVALLLLLLLLLLILAFGHAGPFSQTGAAGGAEDGPDRGQADGASDGRGTGTNGGSGRQRGADLSSSSESDSAREDSPEINGSNDSGKPSNDSSSSDSHGHQLTSPDPLLTDEYAVNPVADGADTAAAGTNGSGGGSEFFGVKAKGRTFVYVVDRSGSMDGAPFAKAREELLRSLDNLSSRQTFYVIFFDDQSYPMFSPGQAETAALRATSRNVDRVRQWADSLIGGGGTDPQASLLHALELQPDAIYLLSDGQFEAGIVDDVSRHNHGRVVISTIAFMNKIGEPLLKQLAHKNGGAYRFVP